MARCIFCGSRQMEGGRLGRATCLGSGQEQPKPGERNRQARLELDELIRERVGDQHDYVPSGRGKQCLECGLAEWLHHPGFTRR
jgi:hypothetical protein